VRALDSFSVSLDHLLALVPPLLTPPAPPRPAVEVWRESDVEAPIP
jgi:hypothetical protein